MNISAFGYAKEKMSDEGLLKLSEVTLVGSPTDLRRIAAFLVMSAEKSEKRGEAYGHNHLRDEKDLWPWRDENVDVIVSWGSGTIEKRPNQAPEPTPPSGASSND